MGTQEYYDKYAKTLLQQYDEADMRLLHNLLKNNIPPHSKVLDIGFGSARELKFLHTQGHNIYGIDSTQHFVDHAKALFEDISDHFLKGSLPFENDPPFTQKFDAIISIALWMHLKKEEYAKAVDDVNSMLQQHAIVILSFSKGKRKGNDQRRFEEVDTEYLAKLFKRHNLVLTENISTPDSLNRGTLEWITQVYRR